ncbi:hypothetical protein GJ496_000281 [Pomphorhynchus laevis]|nr:hypothetical protein GJ496_000281 [Pomphorhynchus laevis]
MHAYNAVCREFPAQFKNKKQYSISAMSTVKIQNATKSNFNDFADNYGTNVVAVITKCINIEHSNIVNAIGADRQQFIDGIGHLPAKGKVCDHFNDIGHFASNNNKDTMPVEKLAEIGRICLITDGSLKKNVCCIVDIIDPNRALVDGPAMRRRVIRFRALHLTTFKINILRGVRHSVLMKAWKEVNLSRTIADSIFGQRLKAQIRKDTSNDFQRFKSSYEKRRMNKRIDMLAKKLMLKDSSKGRRNTARKLKKYGAKK